MPASVHFLLGRAGSGKTRHIIQSLQKTMQSGKRAILLVPEQFTYEAERALTKAMHGLLGIQVLSFARLAERITGRQDRPFLSQQGRRMVMRRAIYKHRHDLTAFSPVATRPGFAAQMDELFSQCKRYLITPDMLKDAAEALPPHHLLQKKLLDMSTLFSAVQAYLDGHFLDGEDAHNALLRMLPQSFLKGIDVYIDGFDGMTSQLYAILAGMMAHCRSLNISLCMDASGNAPDAALFSPEQETYAKLSEYASMLGCETYVQSFSHAPSQKAPALVHLEHNLYAYPYTVYDAPCNGLSIVGAVDRAAEVEHVAHTIKEMVRSGFRYRDIAVLAADLPAYSSLVLRAFAQQEIPLFLDTGHAMQGHPAVDLLLSAAYAAANGISRAALIRIAKTGLSGVCREDAEAFENYCLRRGLLGGSVFEEPFPPEEQSAERTRATLMPPLITLRKAFASATTSEKTQALYAYLQALDVRAQLEGQLRTLQDEGRFALVEEHAQVWEVLMELFSQLQSILGEARMGKQEYLEVLEEALSAYTVGIIPATADRVLFGDIARTKTHTLRALFLLGCNEGFFPRPQQDHDIIDDADLAELRNLGLAPWGDTQLRMQVDQLSLYRTISRAYEQLHVCFSYSDGRRELTPASLLDRIKTLFPRCKEQPAATLFSPGVLPQSERSGFSFLLQSLDAQDALHHALRAHYAQHPLYGEKLALAHMLSHAPAARHTLGPSLAQKLYGQKLITTVSRLMTYRECPFRHFAQYGLQATPRPECKEKRADIGSFSHMALDAFVREMQIRKLSYAAITPEEIDELLDGILPACLDAYKGGLLLATPRMRMLSKFWVQAVRDTAHKLVCSIQAGSFLPILTEVRFGPDAQLPPVILLLKNGQAALSGVIDRIDATVVDGQQLLRVVDYKTGDANLRYGELADGLALQLPIYLKAAEALQAGVPAGMFYQPIREYIAEEDAEEKSDAVLRMHGMLVEDPTVIGATETALSGASQVVAGLRKNSDGTCAKSATLIDESDMRLLLQFAVKRAGDIAEELLSGRVDCAPAVKGRESVCAYCDYGSVCRFDSRLPGCLVRYVKTLNKEGLLQVLRRKGDDPL